MLQRQKQQQQQQLQQEGVPAAAAGSSLMAALSLIEPEWRCHINTVCVCVFSVCVYVCVCACVCVSLCVCKLVCHPSTISPRHLRRLTEQYAFGHMGPRAADMGTSI